MREAARRTSGAAAVSAAPSAGSAASAVASGAAEADSAASAAVGSAAAGRAGAGEGGRMLRASGVILLAVALGGCGYNRMVQLREAVDSSWAQVDNQLQRRTDLIPNLVEVTRGYASHERAVFQAVAD